MMEITDDPPECSTSVATVSQQDACPTDLEMKLLFEKLGQNLQYCPLFLICRQICAQVFKCYNNNKYTQLFKQKNRITYIVQGTADMDHVINKRHLFTFPNSKKVNW